MVRDTGLNGGGRHQEKRSNLRSFQKVVFELLRLFPSQRAVFKSRKAHYLFWHQSRGGGFISPRHRVAYLVRAARLSAPASSARSSIFRRDFFSPGRTFLSGRFLSSHFCSRPEIPLITGKGQEMRNKGPTCSIFPSVWCYASPRIKGVSTAETGIDLSLLLSLSQAAVQACRG